MLLSRVLGALDKALGEFLLLLRSSSVFLEHDYHLAWLSFVGIDSALTCHLDNFSDLVFLDLHASLLRVEYSDRSWIISLLIVSLDEALTELCVCSSLTAALTGIGSLHFLTSGDIFFIHTQRFLLLRWGLSLIDFNLKGFLRIIDSGTAELLSDGPVRALCILESWLLSLSLGLGGAVVEVVDDIGNVRDFLRTVTTANT